MQTIDSLVNVRIRIDDYRPLVHRIARLPRPYRPNYFTSGGRVRDKSKSLIEDATQFDRFVDECVDRAAGFDLIGAGIRFSFFTGETRTVENRSTHVGCSVLLSGSRWNAESYVKLLRQLCCAKGTESGETCRRSEWKYRHLCVKELPEFTIERTLGTDMSAALPGLYWWTVFSAELAARHDLDIAELTAFSMGADQWVTDEGQVLHVFRLYDEPDDWLKARERVSDFLERHANFFSLTRLVPAIDRANSKADFDAATIPFVAGTRPWILRQ